MKKIFPPKLKLGDRIRVIAPSRSMNIVSKETRQIANKRLAGLDFKLNFSEYVEESNLFNSSRIESRVKDLHEAFRDREVKGILTAIGGFSSNQLLRYLDWDLIKRNPKVFCGYSDVTVLNNAIFAKTGLVTYSGPFYSNFGQKLYFDYILDYFKKCLMKSDAFDVFPSESWSDDRWYMDQEDRHLMPNLGWMIINEGEAKGTVLGGNLSVFSLLRGTEYFPDLKGSILFLEDDDLSKEYSDVVFDANLQSLIQQRGFSGVSGLIIGRFQKASQMTEEKIIQIIKTKKELEKIPVVANVDFGHTDPKITFPIGGTAKIIVKKKVAEIEIINH